MGYDERVQAKIAGINHQAWLLECTRDGVDLYPEIKRRARLYNAGKLEIGTWEERRKMLANGEPRPGEWEENMRREYDLTGRQGATGIWFAWN
jgi:alpha-galactosidase